MLAEALEKAKAENKRVFLIMSASWCGPCRMLARFLAAHKGELDPHYVFVKLDISRDEHADALSEHYKGNRDGGIPWYAILDDDGKEIVTSNKPASRPGQPAPNIGFPTDPSSIDHFLGMIKRTAPRMSDETLKQLARGAREETIKTWSPLKFSGAHRSRGVRHQWIASSGESPWGIGSGPVQVDASRAWSLREKILAHPVEPRVLAQVGGLVGVVLEVEEPLVGPRERAAGLEVVLPLAPAGADDQLVAVGSDHGLLVLRVLAEDRIPALGPGLPSIRGTRSRPCRTGGLGMFSRVQTVGKRSTSSTRSETRFPCGRCPGQRMIRGTRTEGS